MNRPTYCRTSMQRIGVCTCYRCKQPTSKEKPQ